MILMSVESPSKVLQQSLINDICSVQEKWTIVAYDNDITPFQLVFLVLRSVVPMSDKDAYDTTYSIHMEGKAVVYEGTKEHCHKIGDAFDKIRVGFKVY